MNNYSEINYLKKIARINYCLLALFLAISMTSHLIAFRLSTILNHPIFPSSFVYMADFILIDVFAAFNSRKFTILVIILECFVNLFMLTVTNIVIYLPHPMYFLDAKDFANVFAPIKMLYIANLAGTFIAFLIDISIFYYFYKTKKHSFFISSIISSVSTILIYTVITDYFAFKDFYPAHIHQLIIVNIITNFISLIFYTILGRISLIYIFKYLNNT